MENQEAQWQSAEKNLKDIERHKREKESLERERRVRGDTAGRGEIKREEAESAGQAPDIRLARERLLRARSRFSGDGSEQETAEDANDIDARIESLQESLVERMGARPKKRAHILDREFPRGQSETAEWQMASFREAEFMVGMKKFLALKASVEAGEKAMAHQLMEISRLEEEGQIILSQSRAEIDELHQEIERNKILMEELLAQNPEVFVGAHLLELREYSRDLEDGRIVETPYVQKQKERIIDAIRAGEHLFIHGNLGSGKSEIAMAAAREYLSSRSDEEIQAQVQVSYDEWLKAHPNATAAEREKRRSALGQEARGALIISGSAQMHQSELYGHRALNIKEFFTAERLAKLGKIEEEYKEWEKNTPDASPELKTLHYQGLLKVHLDEGTGTFSDFFIGPVYRAMRDGRPLIIDEIDYIKPDVLASLNHILTRVAGESLTVQQDSGEEIKMREGFCVIATGNFPSDADVERYVGTQKMNAAFLSRLRKMEYDYLPQSVEPNFDAAPAEAKTRSELFHMLIARAIDRYGNISAPKGSIEKLWKLAVFARKSQDIFSGKWADEETGEVGLTREMVGDEVLSPRHLTRIIEEWKRKNMRYELDHYIFDRFILEARGNERAALYKIAQDIGLFDEKNSWVLAADIESGVGVAKLDIKSPKNIAGKPEWHGPRDTIGYAFGEPPERKVWPEEEKMVANELEGIDTLLEFSNIFRDELKELEGEVNEFCELETSQK